MRDGGQLGGASITCNRLHTVTLFDGTYTFENLVPATYQLCVSLKGFEAQNKTVRVERDDDMTLDFWLTKAEGSSHIHGHVYDKESRKPISSGGTVILILPIVNKYAPIDAGGAYQFDKLVADTYDLWVSIPGYEEVSATISVSEGEVKTVDFHCPPLKSVEPPWG